MKTKRYIFSIIVALSVISGSVHADEITLPYKKLTLNANLVLAESKHLADGVVLITHGGLAHNRMEFVAYLQHLFKERGYNTLAINLSLGIDNRHGMYDCKVTHRHRNADAADEIGAWLDWLKNHGVKQVVLLGHSRGGAQTALYAAERDNSMVQAVVLMSPATSENNDAAEYQRRFNTPLMPVLEAAQKLVKEGRGDTVIHSVGLMNCVNTSATADSFVSYYEPNVSLDTPRLIPKFSKPVLVMVAGNDEVVVGLGKKVAPLVDGVRVQMKVIDGADHLYRDLYSDDAVDAIDAYLKQISNSTFSITSSISKSF